MSSAEPFVELRLLTGPNLYFPRPAVKLTLDGAGVLGADAGTVVGWQRALGVRGGAVGLPFSPVRLAAAAALAAAVIRRAGATLGLRVAALARPGDEHTVVVAFPFRRPGTAAAFGTAAARAFHDITSQTATWNEALTRIPAALAGVEPGEPVRPLRPRIPVIAVTGTNGKTTTTRLIAHLIRAGGRTPGWSSTEGIFVDGETIEDGDWSGPGGAAKVLADPRVQVAVTETARGGILLRGVGTATNDVSVVTNISADHLGLLGVHTVEQLAEVKSVVVAITRATGWTVLNADDPLVRAMRSVTRARPWFYSPDPENPFLAEALTAGGRAITVADGEIVVLQTGLDPRRVMAIADIPLTLGGISRVNVANVLAAIAAALAVSVPLPAIREGLRTFTSGTRHNAGRLNLYRVGEVCVLLDLAHNEASLASLLEVGAALRRGSGRLVAVVGTPGDRTDQAIHTMGKMAALAADRVVIAGRTKYLRSRQPGEMEALWRAGAAEGGQLDAAVSTDELSAVTGLLDADLPAGSVLAVCSLDQRAATENEIAGRGGAELTAAGVREWMAGRAP